MLRFHSLPIVELRRDAEDSLQIALEVPEELRETFRFKPGQHVVIRARPGGEEVRRTYSLVNAPGEWPLRIGVRIHEGGRLSQHLARNARPGEMLEVMPPGGSFTPRSPAGEPRIFVAFASGCGITPVLGITKALLARRDGSRILLFYGNRTTARTMFLEELLALKDAHVDRLALHFVMSREPQEIELFNGRLDAAKLRRFAGTLFDPQAVAEYFLCGPGTMIEDLSAALRELGVEPGRIHAEHFSVETAAGAADVAAPREARAGAAQVTVIMDGRRRTFTMERDGETVLDAAARAGIDLPYSCRAGVCSTCRTKVVRGQVEMAQNFALEDWEVEAGFVLACQSRVLTDELELDYDEK